MSEAVTENLSGTTGGNGSSPLMGWTATLIGSVGTKLKEVRANLEEKSPTATESAFSSDAHEAASEAEAKMQPATDRAEAALDKAGERLGIFAAALSHRVRKAAALAREEAEDMFAEAQSLRRSDAS